MDFDSARKQYQRLSRLFHSGEITEDEFVQGVDALAFTDQDGTEWQIGLQSGRWYRREGSDWVEDTPGKPVPVETPKQGRRALLALLVLILLLLALFGANYFSNTGNTEPDPKGEGAVDEQTLSVAQSTATQTPGDSGEEAGETEQTPTPTLPPEEPASSPTATLLPPLPRVPPQVWEIESEARFTSSNPLVGEWLAIPEFDWEYEYIDYEDREGLYLQYTDRVVLWHADLVSFAETDRSLTVALANAASTVSMACRFNPGAGTGYTLELTRNSWALKFFLPNETFVLAEGAPDEEFQRGGYETFRLRCAGDRITAWDSRGLLASVEHTGNPEGALGVLFNTDQGVGVAVIAGDKVWVKGENKTAGVGDTVWLGGIEVILAEIYFSGTSAEPILASGMRIANWGEIEVTINLVNLYLTDGDQRIYPLEFVSTDKGDGLLPLPMTPDPEYTIGEVYFTGITPDEIGDWQLVLDLRYEGFGEAVFSLGE